MLRGINSDLEALKFERAQRLSADIMLANKQTFLKDTYLGNLATSSLLIYKLNLG